MDQGNSRDCRQKQMESVYIISNLVDVWRTLNEYTNGFIISASESDLNAHKETHEIFRLALSNISTITLQHGFECAGFLMNSNHQNNMVVQ